MAVPPWLRNLCSWPWLVNNLESTTWETMDQDLRNLNSQMHFQTSMFQQPKEQGHSYSLSVRPSVPNLSVNPLAEDAEGWLGLSLGVHDDTFGGSCFPRPRGGGETPPGCQACHGDNVRILAVLRQTQQTSLWNHLWEWYECLTWQPKHTQDFCQWKTCFKATSTSQKELICRVFKHVAVPGLIRISTGKARLSVSTACSKKDISSILARQIHSWILHMSARTTSNQRQLFGRPISSYFFCLKKVMEMFKRWGFTFLHVALPKITQANNYVICTSLADMISRGFGVLLITSWEV